MSNWFFKKGDLKLPHQGLHVMRPNRQFYTEVQSSLLDFYISINNSQRKPYTTVQELPHWIDVKNQRVWSFGDKIVNKTINITKSYALAIILINAIFLSRRVGWI